MTAVAVELARRRHAAQRCPRLVDGRRDPLDRLPSLEVTPAELAAWRATWAHLRVLGFNVDVPAEVVAAGQRERFSAGAS